MHRKILKIILGAILIVAAYLLAANWSFYYRLSAAHLTATDNRHQYMFNKEAATSTSIIYSALGDSLTAGVGVSAYEQSYPYLVAQAMAGNSINVRHLNYSYPGARTDDLIKHLLPLAVADKPDVVTVLIGTNDVHDNVSQTVFRSNYETILSQLRTKTKAKINLVSIPFLGTDSMVLPPFNYYFHAKILDFNKIIQELASKYHANYIDLTTPTTSYADKPSDYYAADNFHPAAAGYQLWSRIIYDHLDK
jgi:lysophospholipase L1-like esterase